MTNAMHPESSVRNPATGSPEPLPRTVPPVSGTTQGASVAPSPTAAPNPTAPSASTQQPEDDGVTVDQVRMTLRRVKDPDLNLNIIDLGLIYDVQVVGSTVQVDMSLTSPGCPSGPEIMGDAERQLREIPGVTDVTINLVWTPFWSPDRIEPRVRAYLGM
jgi:metal-sulfur cluster biosynthetic enzyme